MTAAMHLPVYEPRERFEPGRIRAMERGDKLLVMDRISGRFVLLDGDEKSALALLGAEGGVSYPPKVAGRVQELRRLLVAHGVGVPGVEKHFEDYTTLIIKLTNACNMACAYCYDYEPTERARVIPAEDAHRAIEQAIDLCKGKLWVILHGGEPMLVWDLVEDIVRRGKAYARRRGVSIDFTGQTNLTRLTERIVAFSKEHEIAWGVSLDGAPRVHDALRMLHDGSGSYALFEAARVAFPAFVRRCAVMTTVTRSNQDQLLACARHFRDIGVASWDWSLFHPIGRGRDAAPFEIDVDVLLPAYTELFQAVVAGELDGFPVMPVKKYLDNFFRGPGPNMCLRAECGAARDLLSLSSDGTIEACDCIDPKGPLSNLGNIRRTSLAEARKTPRADEIRSRDMNTGECGACIWFGVCGGTCLAHAGAIDAVWPEGCAVSLHAFDLISLELSRSDALQRYLRSLA